MIPINSEGYQLLHEGTLACAQIEANGFCVDQKYVKTKVKEVSDEIQRIKHEMKNGKECKDFFKRWKQRYGEKTNLGSYTQIGQMAFGVFKYKGAVQTASGKFKASKEVLEDVNLPIVRQFVQMKKLEKARSAYLLGFLNHLTPDGLVHATYNLHLARTYRSSVDSPPLQQIPIRDEEIAALVRPAVKPRKPSRHIVEHDFSGIEVKVSACYNKDPALITYIEDPTTDMHRDMAMQCYMVTLKQMTKLLRYCAKNKFVFPQFYGDWFVSCARNLWLAIDRLELKTAQGVPLKNHLKKKGIRKLGNLNIENNDPTPGTFIYHLKEVEKDFWENRFKVYNQWKWDWFTDYQDKGYFDTYTGFRCSGFMNKKQCVNYPIQGSAFHCLLWCVIEAQKALRKHKMKSVIIGQIHDSILADVPSSELTNYCEIVQEIMTEKLLKHWDWIIVPIEVEAEIAPKGKSWFEKKGVA